MRRGRRRPWWRQAWWGILARAPMRLVAPRTLARLAPLLVGAAACRPSAPGRAATIDAAPAPVEARARAPSAARPELEAPAIAGAYRSIEYLQRGQRLAVAGQMHFRADGQVRAEWRSDAGRSIATYGQWSATQAAGAPRAIEIIDPIGAVEVMVIERLSSTGMRVRIDAQEIVIELERIPVAALWPYPAAAR